MTSTMDSSNTQLPYDILETLDSFGIKTSETFPPLITHPDDYLRLEETIFYAIKDRVACRKCLQIGQYFPISPTGGCVRGGFRVGTYKCSCCNAQNRLKPILNQCSSNAHYKSLGYLLENILENMSWNPYRLAPMSNTKSSSTMKSPGKNFRYRPIRPKKVKYDSTSSSEEEEEEELELEFDKDLESQGSTPTLAGGELEGMGMDQLKKDNSVLRSQLSSMKHELRKNMDSLKKVKEENGLLNQQLKRSVESQGALQQEVRDFISRYEALQALLALRSCIYFLLLIIIYFIFL